MPYRSATLKIALLIDESGSLPRLADALSADPGVDLAWAGGSAAALLDWLAGHPVDVLLVDLGLPDGGSIGVIRRCLALQPDCDVMVVTQTVEPAQVLRALAVGAHGCLLADGSEQDLVRHVRELHAGGSPMSPIIMRGLLQQWRHGPPTSERAGVGVRPLTPREGEVLALVARGFSHEEVARRMAVTLSTVRTHVRSIYAKLEVHSKTEAVFEARAQGLI